MTVTTLSTVEQPASPFSVAVVDDDPKLRTRLAMQLGEAARAGAFGSLRAVEEKMGQGRGLVLVLGPSFGTPHALDEVARLVRARHDVTAVMVLEELSTEILQRAIRAGVSDVIAMSTEPGQLLEAVERAADAIAVPAPAPPVVAAVGPESDQGRVVTVFATKGGAGTSFVATNLAVLLARNNDKPVAIVDADLQFGDVAVMLKLTPQHTIIEAIQQIDRLDATLLKSLLVRHELSGVLVLPAPIEPAFADSVTLPDMLKIVAVLRSFCSHVVIDTPTQFTDIILGLLEETDDIVLIAGMDIPHIKNVKIALQTLRLLNIPAGKVKLALNRANSRVKLDVGEVERTLQMKADCLLPSDVAVPRSINKGVPIVIDAPRSGVSRNLERLAALFPARAGAQVGGR